MPAVLGGGGSNGSSGLLTPTTSQGYLMYPPTHPENFAPQYHRPNSSNRHPPTPNEGSGIPELISPEQQRLWDLNMLSTIIKQWNANRLDLFALSLPNENLEFHGVMRFYYQSQDNDEAGQKVATKCIRVSSTATTKEIIETLIEKFRPDMKMLEVPEYALYEIHETGERQLTPEEKPLLVQLNWHKDDREGRFLLRRMDEASKMPEPTKEDTSFKRKLSKREKKELKKQEKQNKIKDKKTSEGVAEKLYTELPDTSFTRSISNPEAVMRRRRQQKLEKKLQQFRSKDGGPDTGGTLKVYGETLCKDVPYKTLLLSVSDSSQTVIEEMLDKYGKDPRQAQKFCLVQKISDPNTGSSREIFLDDEDCPLSILMTLPPTGGNTTFHVRVKPPDFLPRKRKKITDGFSCTFDNGTQPRPTPPVIPQKLPCLFETNADGSEINNGIPQRFLIPPNVTELGSDVSLQDSGQCLILQPGPSIFPRHCVLAHTEGVITVTPSHREAETYVNNQRIYDTTILQHGTLLQIGRTERGAKHFRFIDPGFIERERARMFGSSVTFPDQPRFQHQQQMQHELNSMGNYVRCEQAFENSSQVSYPPKSRSGRDNILPAVLEFREETEEAFFDSITTSLDINRLGFKLAPTYTIYMATRFRASTHYRPELTPEERAERLTAMLNRVADKILTTVEMRHKDPGALAFWMANSSELLHFLKTDRHITSFSLQAQGILADTVHLAFKELVACLQNDLNIEMIQILSSIDDDDDLKCGDVIKGIMNVLSFAMGLLRKSRVNAALTIQLFSQLFHFINMWTFNQIVLSSGGHNYCTRRWGQRLKRRLSKIENWAERQGLELAADCHLARVVQAAHLLMARKNTAEDIASLSSNCFKLNSLQLKTLLTKYVPAPNEKQISPDMIDTIVRVAEDTTDEATNMEGKEVRLEEDHLLQLPFLLPEDGYSCDIVKGVPNGLFDFVSPLQQVGLCVMTPQPSSNGIWTIYLDRPDMSTVSSPVPSETCNSHQTSAQTYFGSSFPEQTYSDQPNSNQLRKSFSIPSNEPEVQTIQLAKSLSGMGLSIVAAKGVGKDRLGIYIKAVVEGGAAYIDGRLQAGDQLLRVDGQSLIGITQEKAAEIMLHTGPVVELEVAKKGALYDGLATLLSQPSPLMSRSGVNGSSLMQSKSVSSLYPTQEQTYVNQNQTNSTPHFSPSEAMIPPKLNMIGYTRSSSVQNITVPSQNEGRASVTAFEEKNNFYQNVSATLPYGSNHQEIRSQLGARSPSRFSNTTSHNMSEVYHASPRVAGTPISIRHPGHVEGHQSGPEKPIRHYLYENEVLQNRGSQVNSIAEIPTALKKVSQNGSSGNYRVRFQEPNKLASCDVDQDHANDMARRMDEQMKLSSVDQECRLRVDENNMENGSDEDMSKIYMQRTLLNKKRKELESQEAAERKLLMEAEKRRMESSRGTGETPPPLPSMPPPVATPPPSATGRLDMLVGAKNVPNKETPTKKVSFITESGVGQKMESNSSSERMDPNAFITEAESLLNSSNLALERFDFNKSSGHTPNVIGSQEVYRDPRQKLLQKAQEEKASANKRDGAKLSFQEKLAVFANSTNINDTNQVREKAKISRAQREIEAEKPSSQEE